MKNYRDEEKISKRGFKAKTPTSLYVSPLRFNDPPPENLCPSPRFFVPSGSPSSRIVDETSSSSVNASDDGGNPDDFITEVMYSPDPYGDFRRSMQEMVDARMGSGGKVDWEFLEELLFCYLDVNDKKSHGYIFRALVNLIIALRENSGRVPPYPVV